MESLTATVASNKQKAKNQRTKSPSVSFLRWLKKITRREAQNHVDSVWVAHQCLIPRCLVLKFGKQSANLEGQGIVHIDHDVCVNSEFKNGIDAQKEGQQTQSYLQLKHAHSTKRGDQIGKTLSSAQMKEKRSETLQSNKERKEQHLLLLNKLRGIS